jgi:hypothetical protein
VRVEVLDGAFEVLADLVHGEDQPEDALREVARHPHSELLGVELLLASDGEGSLH